MDKKQSKPTGKKFHAAAVVGQHDSANYAIASAAVINQFRYAAPKMHTDSRIRMQTMNPTYYTVTRFLWSTALKHEVWFRLTYERTYLAERGLYRDQLVHAEITS